MSESLKDKINNSLIFSTDKDKDPVLYKKLRIKLIEALYSYMPEQLYRSFAGYSGITKHDITSCCGECILKIIDNCLKNYNKDLVKFTTYFYKSIKNEVSKLIKRYAKKADVTESLYKPLGGEEDFTIEDTIGDNKTYSPEQSFLMKERMAEYGSCIKQAYKSLQARSKRVVAAYFMVDIAEIFLYNAGGVKDIKTAAMYIAKDNPEICSKVLKFCKRNGSVDKKTVADWLDVSAPSASRTYNNFCEAVRRLMCCNT